MIEFDLEDRDLKVVEEKIFREAVLITALINSRGGKIVPSSALILGAWEILKGKTDKQGYINLYVALINGGITEKKVESFLKRIKDKYVDRLADHFKK